MRRSSLRSRRVPAVVVRRRGRVLPVLLLVAIVTALVTGQVRALRDRLVASPAADISTDAARAGAAQDTRALSAITHWTPASPVRADSGGSAGPVGSSSLSPSTGPAVFGPPVAMPGDIAYEPSIALAPDGTVYVTGPTGLFGGLVDQVDGRKARPASPLWKSTDGGASFKEMPAPANLVNGDAGAGGGDSDVVVDNFGNVVVTSLWLGNTSTAVSSDGGSTWFASPASHITPADDRPWFAYDRKRDELYLAWDDIGGPANIPGVIAGVPVYPSAKGALHVARTTLRHLQTTSGVGADDPRQTVVFDQDVSAVPEDGSASAEATSETRNCLCPPGEPDVAPDGSVYLPFSAQNGLRVAESHDQGKTWTQSLVPDSGMGVKNASLLIGYAFPVVRADKDGNLYLAWAARNPQASTVRVYFSWRGHDETAWHAPVVLSTASTALYPAMAVVAPGVVDVAYLGSTAGGWDLRVAQNRHATTAGSLWSDVVAAPRVISGSLDRNTVGDFISVAVDSGHMLDVAFNETDSTGAPSGVFFTRQAAPFPPPSVTGPFYVFDIQAPPPAGHRPAPVQVVLPPSQPAPPEVIEVTPQPQPSPSPHGLLAPVLDVAPVHQRIADADAALDPREHGRTSAWPAAGAALLLIALFVVAGFGVRGLRR